MKKPRMVAGIVLTAGLGLTGVVTASSSGAATPDSAKSAQAAKAQAAGTTAKGGGPGAVCVVEKGGKPGLPLPAKPGVPVPGKPVPGKPLPGGPATAELPGKAVVIKMVNGKVYVNGKQAKGKITKCPLPPLPPLPGRGGKGVFCIQAFEPGKGHVKPGTRTTVKVVNGKVYVNGKLVPKAELNKHCPPLPPFPGKGGGVIVEPGQGGVGSVTFPAAGGSSLTWSQGGTTVKGSSTDSTDESGLTTSGLRG